jgi:hypothetical protein
MELTVQQRHDFEQGLCTLKRHVRIKRRRTDIAADIAGQALRAPGGVHCVEQGE